MMQRTLVNMKVIATPRLRLRMQNNELQVLSVPEKARTIEPQPPQGSWPFRRSLQTRTLSWSSITSLSFIKPSQRTREVWLPHIIQILTLAQETIWLGMCGRRSRRRRRWKKRRRRERGSTTRVMYLEWNSNPGCWAGRAGARLHSLNFTEPSDHRRDQQQHVSPSVLSWLPYLLLCRIQIPSLTLFPYIQ